jgi:hypothetical protein
VGLAAGPEQFIAIIEAYRHPPAAIDLDTPTCAESTEHVSLERKHMPKCKIPRSLHQNGYLYQRGLIPIWYGRYRRPVRLRNGPYVLKPKNARLGPVSDMTEDDARCKLRRLIDGVQTRTAPEDDVTVKEFYLGHFKPEHVDK